MTAAQIVNALRFAADLIEKENSVLDRVGAASFTQSVVIGIHFKDARPEMMEALRRAFNA